MAVCSVFAVGMMCGRVVAALLALVACARAARITQNDHIFVEVSNDTEDMAERRMTSHLIHELNRAKEEALLMYTDYSSRAGADMSSFQMNISAYADEAVKSLEIRPAGDQLPGHHGSAISRHYEQNLYVVAQLNEHQSQHCRELLDKRLKKVQLNAFRGASFSGENHHKFLLGHMIVFRMHLNKTEEYIRKCERALYGCGAACENSPKVRRWKRLALEEMHRVQDDLQHSRRAYQDLVWHARRRLTHLRRQIHAHSADAVAEYHHCLDGKDYDWRWSK